MRMTEAEIYELEKGLIEKYEKLIGHVKPRKMKFVRNVDFSGMASKQLEINEDWLKTATEEKLKDILKHELAHYAVVEFYSHGKKFRDLCTKLGCSQDDLNYSIGKALEDAPLFGMVSEKYENNSIIARFLEKPNWENFRNGILFHSGNQGLLFQALRRRMRKARKKVAEEMGISDNILKKLEARSDWNINSDEQPIIKTMLHKYGIDGDYRKKRDREIFRHVTDIKFWDEASQKNFKPQAEIAVMFWDDSFQKKLFKIITTKKKR
jgi:transcriptional regulator with XRE-family HTH domain